MPSVLLITDNERVQRLFESLKGDGPLQLRAAGTLSEGDEAIAASVPDAVFVQSRLSGFSGEIVVRHLKKTLPSTTKVTLLAVDQDDAAQARKRRIPVVELWADDAALQEQLEAVLRRGKGGKGRVANRRRTPREAAPAPAETSPSPAKEAPLHAAGTPPDAAAEAVEQAAAAFSADESAGWRGRGAKGPAGDELVGDAQVEREPSPQLEAEDLDEEAAEPEATSFAELMRRAAAKRAPAAPEVAERAGPAVVPPPRAGENEPAPAEVEDKVRLGVPPPGQETASTAAGKPEEPKRPAPAGQEEGVYAAFPLAESLEEGKLRAYKAKRPQWFLPLAIGVLLIPLLFYLVTMGHHRPGPRKGVKQRTEPRTMPSAPTAAGPARAPAQGQAPAKPAPAAPSGAHPAPAAASKRPAAPQRAAQSPLAPGQKGLKSLPPFVAGARPDPSYGKSHPGWLRYIGPLAQYRLFREGGTFRALQVIPAGRGPIPDQLYQRALLEFGGIDSYQIQSTDTRGKYLIQHGVAKGGVGVTLYRDKRDLSLRGLVVYYR